MAQKQYKFTLSIRDKHNREVKKIVDFLIGKGILSQAIRDGLRLLNDLRKGNTRVLLEMFPDVMDKLCPPQSNNGDILLKLDSMEREIHELKNHRPMPQDSDIPDTRGYGIPAMKSLGAGIGSTLGTGKLMALPTFDDDDDGDTLVITKSTGVANGANFMASMANVAY